MKKRHRRQFLKTSLGATLFADLQSFLPISQAVASDVELERGLVRFGPDMDSLVKLIERTPREKCIPVFMDQFTSGLSYRRFLAALFLAAARTGDLHQLAQVYAAHRTSSSVRIEERLLPLFWVLDRIKKGQEHKDSSTHFLQAAKGTLPKPSEAVDVFQTAMLNSDQAQAELAALSLARSEGPRHAMYRLWEFASRNLAGTLGHMPIGIANAWRTLDAIGWNHAEPALRYMATEISRFPGDRTYAPNLERVQASITMLPPGWTSHESSRQAALSLYDLLRAGDAQTACNYICSALTSGSAQAGAMWDGISLAAADTIFRYGIGGSAIGGVLVHAVTSTNALRFGFGVVREPATKLLHLLQAASVTADYFVSQAREDGQLRDMNLIEDLDEAEASIGDSYEDVFELLPPKADNRDQQSPAERAASDAASRMAFGLLRDADSDLAFLQTARSFLVRKATEDPHDLKYPAACFEDASLVSPKWRPYLLASSVHALHGTRSESSPLLIQARDAIR